MTTSPNGSKHVVVVGAGGNIGSHLVPHLARAANVGRVTLIDRDVYDRRNLSGQNITPGDVGREKAVVQGRRLARINRELGITVMAEAVERIPVGRLRGDVIVACLDSRRARMYVNQMAWRLGVPWIDAGVDAGGLLARVNVYVPGVDSPCMECGWDEQDYQAIEQAYPCSGFAETSFPTEAPSTIGALAAALQAIECAKVLKGDWESAAVGKQVLINAANHTHFVTAYRRNPDCRLFGHETWTIRKLRRSSNDLTVRDAISLGPRVGGSNDAVGLRVEGTHFVRRLRCISCGYAKHLLRLQNRLRALDEKCRACGDTMVAAGRDLAERLETARLGPDVLGLPLTKLGFMSGDVFSVGNFERVSHFEIA